MVALPHTLQHNASGSTYNVSATAAQHICSLALPTRLTTLALQGMWPQRLRHSPYAAARICPALQYPWPQPLPCKAYGADGTARLLPAAADLPAAAPHTAPRCGAPQRPTRTQTAPQALPPQVPYLRDAAQRPPIAAALQCTWSTTCIAWHPIHAHMPCPAPHPTAALPGKWRTHATAHKVCNAAHMGTTLAPQATWSAALHTWHTLQRSCYGQVACSAAHVQHHPPTQHSSTTCLAPHTAWPQALQYNPSQHTGVPLPPTAHTHCAAALLVRALAPQSTWKHGT